MDKYVPWQQFLQEADLILASSDEDKHILKILQNSIQLFGL